ncbi:aminotransferase class V-fold PLP-dependent enzyme [Virgibacillus sp. 179-BFC.A HS]|uniref:Aminotransferase class V-fold PLP-dependent enzyme n=1 Tax=Tigheibacillus jepli TaxID=3035914 RepID=A0ABU5CKI9_9BACI|nr:aminotransferase class V-fold PLP-dependent enzyme [Virgibacillus sp. 179-BFC.A HS]MDY0406362.1 aminotransferase class V-fold PLP-dependent enzyme [Virgibacillus sp. 179-BFC.A HS]
MGEACSPDELKTYLLGHPNIQVVFLTFCETSTGVLNPVKELAKVVHEFSDAYVVVDGVSSVGGTESNMDEWGIDVLVTGSQKALMLPPGLAFVAVSERAWKRIENNSHPRFYFDLSSYKKALGEDSTPFTPAVSLLFGLKESVTLIAEEGLENVYARHRVMRDMTRKACKALGLPLLAADEFASPTITAVKPEHFSAKQLKTLLKENVNLNVAGGQGHLADEIIRIGHMGYCSPNDVLLCIGLLETGLSKLTGADTFGIGTKEAEKEYFRFISQNKEENA